MKILAFIAATSVLFAACSPTTSPTAPSTPTSSPFLEAPTQGMTAPSSEPTPVVMQSFTKAQVAMHNKETDCYVIINGGVYDVTKTIDMHPGGREAILLNCGKDATKAFTMRNGKGEHPEMAQQGIEQAKIGTISQ